ncbi:MAG: gamma-glutamyl-gamma-aminobutyrate hydrolase family protein [Erysipelotrichaceae bacterium]|nr:gamma-glutamyl-gamma-aminobutyrate hydrolase family protein [Erysipelotrichaceae bacterium]
MKKPIIGIPSKQPYPDEGDLWHRMEIVDELRYLVTEYGGIAIMLLPTEHTMGFNQSDCGDDTILTKEEIEDLHRQVDLCDGILLQGGLYSCSYEVEIARYALKKDLPILGICAGFNNILRALGSNVYEDSSGSHNHYAREYRHPITVVPGTMLYDFIGQEDYQVNSMHTMMATKEMVEPYAKICACDMEGHAESFEVPDRKFVLGIKWHPELMMEEEYTRKLFQAYMDACKKEG